MEQHPIPQDVTGFQFKLIGSMTVKQFAYVAAGVITAVIIYYLPLNFPLSILVKIILIPLIGSSGFVIAFLPIDGRPIDVMSMNLAKAMFSPNQYVYHKVDKHFSFTSIATSKPQTAQATANAKAATPSSRENAKQQQLQALLQHSQGRMHNEMDKKESIFLQSFAVIPQAAPTIATPTQIVRPILQQKAPIIADKPVQQAIQSKAVTPANIPQKQTPEELAKQEIALSQQLTVAKQEEAKAPVAPTSAAHQKVTLLEQQVQQIHNQKQKLEEEIEKLKKQLAEKQAVPTQDPIKQPVTGQQKTIAPTSVSTQKSMVKSAGLPTVSDTPNVVVGIVKDPRGNVLPNMLVEVKDKDGNPVRAFKTNPLGQFASATPLAAGTYTMEIEDPKKKHSFDITQIIANNQIMAPLEINSHDAREALRKELFS